MWWKIGRKYSWGRYFGFGFKERNQPSDITEFLQWNCLFGRVRNMRRTGRVKRGTEGLKWDNEIEIRDQGNMIVITYFVFRNLSDLSGPLCLLS